MKKSYLRIVCCFLAFVLAISQLPFGTVMTVSAEPSQDDTIYLIENIDVTDNNTSSAQSAVFSFDELDSVNLMDKVWIKFDIYVDSIGDEPITVTPSISFVDSDYSSSSRFGNDTAVHKLSISSKKWNRINILTSDFTLKNCNTSEIVGVMISGMVNNFRYTISNLVLSSVEEIEVSDDYNLTNSTRFT